MPKINQLDRHVADLIAAGEVVERPASVIKELVENSIDAGAGVITVEIKAGGMTYIRVTDDGCGIAAEDAKTAFLRHATSKVRNAYDLEAIGTLGFRGEALAAIASVSRIEVQTREKGASEGTHIELEAGDVTECLPCGCPEGTTIIVRDLFFNTPARQKFMKSDRAEASGSYSAVLRCALSHPEISVRFVKDGKTECHTPGDSRIDSCLYSLFGREFAMGMLQVESDDGKIAVTGYISQPGSARGNRNYQFFFVNGRYIRSRTLQAALEQAYANTTMTGRYPAAVMYITTNPGAIDANVHPAKTEVRFISDKQVFDGVYYAVLGALGGGQTGKLELTPSEGAVKMMSVTEQKPKYTQGEGGKQWGGAKDDGFKTTTADDFRKTYAPDIIKTPYPPQERKIKKEPDNEIRQTHTEEPVDQAEPEKNMISTEQVTGSMSVIGEVFSTYIVVQDQGSVWFIDKHAAHERIVFDKLMSGKKAAMEQSLIIPFICRLGSEHAAVLMENAAMLESMGFSLEAIGDDSIAIRGVPSDIDYGDAESVLSEICEELHRGGQLEPAQRGNVLKAIACKAAIKAGDKTDIRELELLAQRVLSGEIQHCPHGRPVAYEITQQELERGFKRT